MTNFTEITAEQTMIPELLDRFRAGDEQAAEQLYAIVRKEFKPLLVKKAGSNWEDALQDVCLRLLEIIPQKRFLGPKQFLSYAHRTALTVCRPWTRRARRQRKEKQI